MATQINSMERKKDQKSSAVLNHKRTPNPSRVRQGEPGEHSLEQPGLGCSLDCTGWITLLSGAKFRMTKQHKTKLMNKLIVLGALVGLFSAGCASQNRGAGADADNQINAEYGIGHGTITTTNSPAPNSNGSSSSDTSSTTKSTNP